MIYPPLLQAPLDLAALEMFRCVAQEESVTRAAARLQRAQSNVTTRVRQLEAELGVSLFLREGKRMALTPEGRVLLDYAHRLLALSEEARQAVLPGQPGGRLRLGSMESTAASRLPAPLVRLHQQWPDIQLELSTGPTQELLERLKAHALDAALVAWPPGQAPDGALETQPVFTEELLLVLPPCHPAVHDPNDVQPPTLAVFEPGCTYRRIAQDWMARRAAPTRPMELGSYHAILACVAGGSCVGVVPASVLALAPQAPLLPHRSITTLPTLLAWRKGYRSAALDALRQALTDAPQGAEP